MVVPGANIPPTNASATPKVYDVLFSNLDLYLSEETAESEPEPAAVGALERAGKSSKPSFEFLGLPESVMRDFRFEKIAVRSGKSHGWHCSNTSGFSFDSVTPMPSRDSGCL